MQLLAIPPSCPEVEGQFNVAFQPKSCSLDHLLERGSLLTFVTFISSAFNISKKDSSEYLRRKISWKLVGRMEEAQT